MTALSPAIVPRNDETHCHPLAYATWKAGMRRRSDPTTLLRVDCCLVAMRTTSTPETTRLRVAVKRLIPLVAISEG